MDYSSARKLQGMSISSSTTPIMPPAGSSSAVDDELGNMLKGMSLSSATPTMPPSESSSGIDNTFIKTLQDMSLSSSSKQAMPSNESSSAVAVKRKRDEDVDQDLAPANKKRIRRDLQPNTSKNPKISKGLMDLPSELRLNILSHALSGAAGPSGTISVNPRAKILSDPSGVFQRKVDSGEGQTKWQARRGMMQTCHQLREEALEVLYNKNTYLARVTPQGQRWNFEKERFSRWLRSLGGDSEIRRVRKVTFAVEGASLMKVGGWERRKGDFCVSILNGKVTVEGSERFDECHGEPLWEIDALITTLLADKAAGEGLDYAQWMLVWYEIQSLTT